MAYISNTSNSSTVIAQKKNPKAVNSVNPLAEKNLIKQRESKERFI